MIVGYEDKYFAEFSDRDFPEKGLEKIETFKFMCGEEQYGEFKLAPLPGCCGVVVSVNSFLFQEKRGRNDISKAFHRVKEKTARAFGYSLMLATTQLVNIPEVVGSANNGWKIQETFRNKRTSHDIGLMVKKLQ